MNNRRHICKMSNCPAKNLSGNDLEQAIVTVNNIYDEFEKDEEP